jgi:hypothetical protein
VAEPRQAEGDSDAGREATLEALPERAEISLTICRATRNGLAEGLRQHLPGAVGIALKGVPLCLFAAFAHGTLDVSAAHTVVGAAAGGAIQLVRSRVSRGDTTAAHGAPATPWKS